MLRREGKVKPKKPTINAQTLSSILRRELAGFVCIVFTFALTVTFRLRAPNAMAVTVRGMTQQPLPMQKDASHLWTATNVPLRPYLYAYTFRRGWVDLSDTRFRPSYHSVP